MVTELDMGSKNNLKKKHFLKIIIAKIGNTFEKLRDTLVMFMANLIKNN